MLQASFGWWPAAKTRVLGARLNKANRVDAAKAAFSLWFLVLAFVGGTKPF